MTHDELDAVVDSIGKIKNTKNYFPNNYSNKINNTSDKFSKQCKNYKKIYQNVFFFKYTSCKETNIFIFFLCSKNVQKT